MPGGDFIEAPARLYSRRRQSRGSHGDPPTEVNKVKWVARSTSSRSRAAIPAKRPRPVGPELLAAGSVWVPFAGAGRWFSATDMDRPVRSESWVVGLSQGFAGGPGAVD